MESYLHAGASHRPFCVFRVANDQPHQRLIDIRIPCRFIDFVSFALEGFLPYFYQLSTHLFIVAGTLSVPGRWRQVVLINVSLDHFLHVNCQRALWLLEELGKHTFRDVGITPSPYLA